VPSEKRFMICSTVLENMRCVVDHLQVNEDQTVTLSEKTARRLHVNIGEQVRFAPQFPVLRSLNQEGECVG